MSDDSEYLAEGGVASQQRVEDGEDDARDPERGDQEPGDLTANREIAGCTRESAPGAGTAPRRSVVRRNMRRMP